MTVRTLQRVSLDWPGSRWRENQTVCVFHYRTFLNGENRWAHLIWSFLTVVINLYYWWIKIYIFLYLNKEIFLQAMKRRKTCKKSIHAWFSHPGLGLGLIHLLSHFCGHVNEATKSGDKPRHSSPQQHCPAHWNPKVSLMPPTHSWSFLEVSVGCTQKTSKRHPNLMHGPPQLVVLMWRSTPVLQVPDYRALRTISKARPDHSTEEAYFSHIGIIFCQLWPVPDDWL